MIVRSGRWGLRAWWRRAAAMLTTPARRRMVMARLRRLAMTAGPVAGADLGAVLVVVHVTDPVERA